MPSLSCLLAGEMTGAARRTATAIAREFHATYERLAPGHGYKTREESAVPWEDVPKSNRDLMVETVHDLLARGIILPGPNPHVSILEAAASADGDSPR